jgi:hypothetical protein
VPRSTRPCHGAIGSARPADRAGQGGPARHNLGGAQCSAGPTAPSHQRARTPGMSRA